MRIAMMVKCVKYYWSTHPQVVIFSCEKEDCERMIRRLEDEEGYVCLEVVGDGEVV